MCRTTEKPKVQGAKTWANNTEQESHIPKDVRGAEKQWAWAVGWRRVDMIVAAKEAVCAVVDVEHRGSIVLEITAAEAGVDDNLGVVANCGCGRGGEGWSAVGVLAQQQKVEPQVTECPDDEVVAVAEGMDATRVPGRSLSDQLKSQWVRAKAELMVGPDRWTMWQGDAARARI